MVGETLVEEWPERVRLAFEKEALGFYLTGHPLQGYEKEARRYASATCAAVASAAAFAPAGGFCRSLAAAACVPRAAHGPPCTAQLRASLPAHNGGAAGADASGAGTARGVPRAPQPEAVRQSGAG